MKEHFVARRIINLCFIMAGTVAFSLFLSWESGKMVDEMLGVLILDAVYLALFAFLLEHERALGRLSGNRECSYHKLMFGYLFSFAVLTAGSVCPEFLKPVIFLPFVMTAVGSVQIAMYTGIFGNAILCLMAGANNEELILYCILTLAGCVLAEAMMKQENKLWYAGIVFAVSVLLPELFYYFAYQELKPKLFLYGGIEGAVAVLFIFTCYQILLRAREQEISTILNDILDESYPAAMELMNFSRQEYEHARNVSRVAAACARLVGADEKLCAAAGFYYRIGIIEGEPIAQSGVLIAQKYCFPEEVLHIIYEYDGKDELPSNVESAIVHMVNGLLLKMEVLNKKTALHSDWNQDMVIYQTLNEYSAAGLYDKSGISMNMFLKIREYLVKEEALV